MFSPPYHLYERELPEEVIATLRKDASRLPLSTARVGPGQELKDRRSSLVGFFAQDHWVHGIMFHYAILANNRSWGMPIIGPSAVQVAIYREGSFFEWHSDNAPTQQGDKVERKISVVMNISGQDFSGGVLELQTDWGNFAPEPMRLDQLSAPGSVAVFPSVAPHRVTPVTAGARITLTTWILGPLSSAPGPLQS